MKPPQLPYKLLFLKLVAVKYTAGHTSGVAGNVETIGKNWDFSHKEVREMTSSQCFLLVGSYLLEPFVRKGLLRSAETSDFIMTLGEGYQPYPYHSCNAWYVHPKTSFPRPLARTNKEVMSTDCMRCNFSSIFDVSASIALTSRFA
jgi:hypothetical protein